MRLIHSWEVSRWIDMAPRDLDYFRLTFDLAKFDPPWYELVIVGLGRTRLTLAPPLKYHNLIIMCAG